jgi:F-type H+-transporting ATPase subunit b
MQALVDTFHIDVKLIIAQLVNFLIVLTVLYYFALKPLMKIMNERSETIEKSLKKAEEIDISFEESKTRQEAMLVKAREEAHAIIGEAEARGLKEQERLKEETKVEVNKLVENAKNQIAHEKEKATKDLRRGTAELVIKASTKVLEKHAPKDLDAKLAEDALKKI